MVPPNPAGTCSQEGWRVLQRDPALHCRQGSERANPAQVCAQQGSGLVWPASQSCSHPGLLLTARIPAEVVRARAVVLWGTALQAEPWVGREREREAGEPPPGNILSPLAASTAGQGLTGCHDCHLPWQQAKAVTASAIAMETMSEGRT